MSSSSLIATYSARLVKREWRRFVLPFLSITVTAVVVVLMLMLTAAGSLLLTEKARELQGGDVVIESNTPVAADEVIAEAGLVPRARSIQSETTVTLKRNGETSPLSVQVVDDAYPLYGTLVVKDATYRGLTAHEVLLDQAAADRLSVTVGETVTLGEALYTVHGIIVSEPTALFGGFRFLPRAIMSNEGFARAGLSPELLRIEYVYAYQFDELSATDRATLTALEDSTGLDIDIAGTSRTGFDRSLTLVSEFLIVAVLVTAVLAAVNVYASTLYLIATLRKSFAVLLALGMRRRTLIGMLGVSLGYVVVIGTMVGITLGVTLFQFLTDIIANTYQIVLPTPNLLMSGAITVLLIIATTSGAFAPAIKKTIELSPKRILVGGEDEEYARTPTWTLLVITLSTLVPLVLLASFLLESLYEGALVTLAITLIYVGVATAFSLGLAVLYTQRARFSFWLRSIIAHKKADGLFGVVSFTSLFVALTALATLTLIQLSLERYLQEDLARTVPTTYIIDVQPSQKEAVTTAFPDLTLFSNVPARIIDIDGRRIQELLAQNDPDTDRELGREYNLTARTTLLESETITRGTWSNGNAGEISVDEDFATRAGITLGSQVTFLIQGFEVRGTVTSMRDTDSRSGLPFFYFVLSPDDIGQFPNVYFGYAFYDAEKRAELARFLAPTMPNVSVIDTGSLGPILMNIVRTLLILVFIIAIPPLLIATILIATLVVSSYASRRREGARLRALGVPHAYVGRHYLIETLSLTLAAAILGYLMSVAVTFGITTYYLDISSPALFDTELIVGLMLIVVFIGMIALYLFRRDTMPLRELLAYEENH